MVETELSAIAQRYLHLLKLCLCREGYPERWRPLSPRSLARRALAGSVQTLLDSRQLALVRVIPPGARGVHSHPDAETMVPLAGLDNLQACCESVIREGVPGDFIETGVWRGGSTILMKAVVEVFADTERVVWAADSFCGLPVPDAERYPADGANTWHEIDEFRVSVDEVKRNFQRYGLLDDRVRFLEGWFKDTLPTAPIESLAVLRMDGDLYESTMESLENLYPKLSVGGYAIVDDFSMRAARQATLDYRAKHDIDDEIMQVDDKIVFWRRSR